MNIKNKLGRAVGIAAAATAIGGLGLTGVASASTAQPTAVTSVSHEAQLASPHHHHRFVPVYLSRSYSECYTWNKNHGGTWRNYYCHYYSGVYYYGYYYHNVWILYWWE